MRQIICLAVGLFCAAAMSASAQSQHTDYVTKTGCVLRASAYFEANYLHPGAAKHTLRSQCALQIVQTPTGSRQWNMTVEGDPQHVTNIDFPSASAFGTRRATTIHATLHQYDICEERVTFHNLDLGPVPSTLFGAKLTPGVTPRYLMLKEPLTATTPSGITVTLPAQGADTLEKVFTSFNGNPNALFIQIATLPSQAKAILPQSPLYKKYGRPVAISLDCSKPNFMSSSMADNTYTTIAIVLPDLSTATHLDSLTLIVRQRVDLEAFPVTLRVPVSPYGS